MKREEAIKMLRGMKAENLNLANLYTKDKYNSLDMAIKALEQEPCEDCISRKAVLNMSDIVGEMPTYSHPYDNLKEVVYVEDIESLPSVTPTCKLKQEPILDKIIAEIETQEKWLAQSGYNAYNVDIAFNSIKLLLAEMESEE
jgi:hypothetical protein